MTITNCEFNSNNATINGVVYAINKLTITSDKFYNNTGSAIYTSNELIIKESSFDSNSYDDGNGSAIQTTQMTPTLTKQIFGKLQVAIALIKILQLPEHMPIIQALTVTIISLICLYSSHNQLCRI